MAGSAWSNQLVDLLVISALTGGYSGYYEYSPSPGAGNLILSITSTALTDPYGNVVPNPGLTSYFNSGSGYVSLNINGGALSWATAPTEAGPWTVAGEIGINIANPTELLINFLSWSHPP